MNYRVRGALFENERDTGPAFTGFVEIDGVKTAVALWPKTSAKGQNYLQVAENKKRQQQVDQRSPPPRSPFNRPHQPQRPLNAPRNDPPFDDMNDEIPDFK
jgi:hypothetical protein